MSNVWPRPLTTAIGRPEKLSDIVKNRVTTLFYRNVPTDVRTSVRGGGVLEDGAAGRIAGHVPRPRPPSSYIHIDRRSQTVTKI